jgi:Putative Actinobacterial Holin-X, holin superfamily III
VAFTLRDQPQTDQDAARAGDGRDGANDRSLQDAGDAGQLTRNTVLELIGSLIKGTSDLADTQIELAKQEVGEARDEALGAVKRLAIGAGIAVAAALLLVISLWTAFIWFFNWLFGFISFPTPFGTQSLAWVGWLLGLALPVIAAYIAYTRYIRPGVSRAMAIWPPLPRTRETLKEDLEWVRHLRTLSER